MRWHDYLLFGIGLIGSLVLIYFGAIWYNPFMYVPGAILVGVLWIIYFSGFLNVNGKENLGKG